MREILISDLNVPPTKMFGGVALFNVSDSYGLLKICEENDVAVLGIEGFRVYANYRVPDMECIADFSGLIESSGDFAVDSRRAAKKFIDDLFFKDMYLEFVLVEP